jgi:hypothetical protein
MIAVASQSVPTSQQIQTVFSYSLLFALYSQSMDLPEQ